MKALTKPELVRMLDAVEYPEERLMMRIAFNHGLRASEVCAIRAEDVNSGYLTVQRLKGSKKTVQPLAKDERAEVEARVSEIKSGPLFKADRFRLYYVMKRKAGPLAGLPAHKCHPHILKHTVATLAVRAGVTVDKIQNLLGHASLGSTGRYFVADDEESFLAVAAAVGGM